ncbi:MAG TPA: TM2 domain-containing protein [Bacilli bacterium]|nr:TM2 domain-containing protein [Bacilli bacterium]
MKKFCSNCGAELKEGADVCIKCGKIIEKEKAEDNNISPKSRLIAFLFCTFLGGLGVHRFYVGKIGTGILWLFTAGCFGIGVLIDWILILCGNFKDEEGLLITNWDA